MRRQRVLGRGGVAFVAVTMQRLVDKADTMFGRAGDGKMMDGISEEEEEDYLPGADNHAAVHDHLEDFLLML